MFTWALRGQDDDDDVYFSSRRLDRDPMQDVEGDFGSSV
jgi:hypothetical protein